MSSPEPIRRYLTNFDSSRMGHILTDVLVVGTGVAGLQAAIAAANHGQVIVLSKGSVSDSATHWAQGGIASVRTPQDSVDKHIADTTRVGAGLTNMAAVELICREGVERITELIEAGLPFDCIDGQLALGLEGGHCESRIVHAGGDATGRELGEFLAAGVRKLERVRIFDHCFLIDLVTLDGVCRGAVTFHAQYGHQLIWAKRTILASGGYAKMYRESTNPPVATGDGMAAALRAGALLADMELVQFHPTTLYVAGATRALISEAVRGEGGKLVDRTGHRFMPEYHDDAELAPRDVVSRAIVDRLRKTEATSVYLDVRHIGADRFAKRFPTITSKCRQFGIDIGEDLIPVRPAAHFSIGGVVTDLSGRTSLDGLLACGEASCTGLHGANRLASNSLLEGLVMGKIAGEQAGNDLADCANASGPARISNSTAQSAKTMLDLGDVDQSLRSILWRNTGIIRHGERLAETVEIIDFWSKFVLDKTFDGSNGWEVQNKLTLARLISSAALLRAESRGVHFRGDCGNAPADEHARHYAYSRNAQGHLTECVLDCTLGSG